MTIKNTFCSAPWVQVRIDWDGRYRPCCELKEGHSKFKGRTQYSLKDTTVDEWMSSEYSQYLRKELAEGHQLEECENCWQKERNSIHSLRQQINDTASNNQGHDLNNTWVKLFVDKNKDYKNYKLISADIKLSNVCNFSCVMCAPYNSSKMYDEWQSNSDNKFVQEYLNKQPTYFSDITANYQTQRGYQHLQNILSYPIKHLKVLGGEPLLDKQLFQILEQQPLEKKTQIHLHMNTNGSKNLVDAVYRLKDYKSVSFTVSLEGVGAMQDYVRRGSHWPSIEKNILNAMQHNILINVHHTTQAMTLLNLPELLTWCYDNHVPVSFGMVYSPDYLSLSVLPPHIRQIAVDKLSTIQHINVTSFLDNELLSVKNLIELVQNFSFEPTLYPKFLEYIDWFERNSTLKLGHLQPAFYAG